MWKFCYDFFQSQLNGFLKEEGNGFEKLRSNFKVLAISRMIFYSSFAIHYLIWIPIFSVYFRSEWLSSDWMVNLALGFIVLASTCAAIGFYSQFFGIAVFFLHGHFLETNLYMYWGWGFVAFFISLLFIFVKSDHVLSINRKTILPRFSGAPYLLLSFVCVIYFTANIRRFLSNDWITGEVLYYVLIDPMYSRLAPISLRSIKELIDFLGRAGWVTEILGIFLVFIPFRGLRSSLAFVLIVLHFVLLITTKVQIWSPFICAILALAWLHLPWDFKKSFRTRIAFVLPSTLFSIFVLYIYLLNFKAEMIPNGIHHSTFPMVQLGGIKAAHLFQNGTHRAVAIGQIYKLSTQGTTELVFESDQTTYAGLAGGLWYSEIDELIERTKIHTNALQSYGHPSIPANCKALGTVFGNSSRYLMRQRNLYIRKDHIEFSHFDIELNCENLSAEAKDMSSVVPLSNLDAVFTARLTALKLPTSPTKTTKQMH